MTKYRTPYTNTPFPDNFNTTGRAPDESGQITPTIEAFLTAPRLLERTQRLIQSGRLSEADANHMLVALRRHHRSMTGDRARPGEVLGDDRLPYEPMPFAPPEQPHPSYLSDTRRGNVMRAAVERMDADRITDGLIATMAEHDPPQVPPRSEQERNEPVSLRDSIAASVDALGG